MDEQVGMQAAGQGGGQAGWCQNCEEARQVWLCSLVSSVTYQVRRDVLAILTASIAGIVQPRSAASATLILIAAKMM